MVEPESPLSYNSSMNGIKNIRNIAIIAHVDHGKSTLADRLLEVTGTVIGSKMQAQLLDSLALERERGITIKLAPVRLKYKYVSETSSEIPRLALLSRNDNDEIAASATPPRNDEFGEFMINMIDTPGHVDFTYEVSRSLAAVEGAILLVDATSGIQAQTLSHGLNALEQNLTLIPVINKIDLPNANLEKCTKELTDTFGFLESEIILASGKTGEGVDEILRAVVERVPAPEGKESEVSKVAEEPNDGLLDTSVLDSDEIAASATPPRNDGGGNALKALIFDSFFDAYKGVIAQVRIVEGIVPDVNSKIYFLGTGAESVLLEKGYFAPQLTQVEVLQEGEIGYIATGIKEPDLVRVGDTITGGWNVENGKWKEVEPLPGYKVVKPMVFVGLYPIDQSEYHDIKENLERFRLSDPAFSYEAEHSNALGAGFRCGFLGLLHAEVVQERLSSEFGVDLLATAPTVSYLVEGEPLTNPAELDFSRVKNIKEPWVNLKIFTPQDYIGPILELVQDKRGKLSNMQYFGKQVELLLEMPLSEMITDFYDRLKSVSSGFASLDWELLEYRDVDAVRVDILVGGEKVDALSTIVFRAKAESLGRKLTERLKEVLPRQNFAIALQATIGGQIIARETIAPFRKDVTAKLYGGDRTRKDKLLDKQKKGKKKMKMIGRVEIPQEAFLSLLKS